MFNVEREISGFHAEAERDFVGLWQIASDVRNQLDSSDQEEIMAKSLKVVEGLFDRGIDPVDFTEDGFAVWRGTATDHLKRIEAEWRVMGRDPTLADPICWFAARPARAAQLD